MLAIFITLNKILRRYRVSQHEKRNLVNSVQLKNPQILMGYFGATYPLLISMITDTPYSAVYQRTCMSDIGPSKFKTQPNFSEGRKRQWKDLKTARSYESPVYPGWKFPIRDTTTPLSAIAVLAILCFSRIFQSPTGYPHPSLIGQDEWVWLSPLPQGPANKRPAKGDRLF